MEDKITNAVLGLIAILITALCAGYFFNDLQMGAPQPVSVFFNQKPHKTTVAEIAGSPGALVTKKWVDIEIQVDESTLREYCHQVFGTKGGPTYNRYIYMIASQGGKKMIVRMAAPYDEKKDRCRPGFSKAEIRDYKGEIKETMRIKGVLRTKLLARTPPDYRDAIKTSPFTIFVDAGKTPNFASTYCVFFIIFLGFVALKLIKRYGSGDALEVKCNIKDPGAVRAAGDMIEYMASFTAMKPFVLNNCLVKLKVTNTKTKNDAIAFEEKKESFSRTTLTRGSVNQFSGSFILPDKDKLYVPGMKWELSFVWNIKGYLDVEENLGFEVVRKEADILGRPKKDNP